MPTAPLEPGFVGREREMDLLLSGLGQAERTQGRLLLIGGEPGIGKTRLSEEFAARAKAGGSQVVWGRCWEAGGAPAFWPWVQAMRASLTGIDLGSLREELGDAAHHLADLLPEVEPATPRASAASDIDPRMARFRLFDSVTRFLRVIAASDPLVLIMDDLHAADESSLLLLRFVSQSLDNLPLLILGMYRNDKDGESFEPTLTELVRSGSTMKIELQGFDRDELSRFIEANVGHAAPTELTTAVFHESEGNPLFAGELVRLLAGQGQLAAPGVGLTRLPIPHGLAETITKRFEYLEGSSARLLQVASVLGREFDLDLLARVSEIPTGEALTSLEGPMRARLVVEVPGAPGRWRFSHALIRDVLYDRTDPSERFQLHERAANELLTIHRAKLGSEVSSVAHHFFAAIPVTDPQKAVDYSEQAGDRASRLLAYEEAARLYRQALTAQGLTDAPDDIEVCDLLLKLGDASSKAGDATGARDTFLQAAAIARRAGHPERLARAALGYGGRFVWWFARNDPHLETLLEEALQTLDPGDSSIRVRVMAKLGAGPLRARSDPRRVELSREALEMARRLGDPSTIAYALSARFESLFPTDLPQRKAVAGEVFDIAGETKDEEGQLLGHVYLFQVALESGDGQRAREQAAAQETLAERLHQPSYQWEQASCRALLALMEGRLDEAEGLIEGAYEKGRDVEAWNASLSYGLQMYVLRWEQGRLAEMEEAIDAAIQGYGASPGWHAVRSHLYKECGRRSDAQREFEYLAERDFAGVPHDEEWLIHVSLLCEVVAYLDDAPRAVALYDIMQPFSGMSVLGPGEVCLGSVDRGLAVLAGTIGRFDDALQHLDRAFEMNSRLRATPWVARTHRDRANVLLARDAPGDRDSAARNLESALDLARRVGSLALVTELESMVANGDGTAPVAPGGKLTALFKREGEYWSIAYEGEICRLKDSKGLRHLSTLLSDPGREFHALDLVQGGTTGRRTSSHRGDPDSQIVIGGEDAGEILDPAAKAAYKQRIDDIDTEMREANEWEDLERASRLQQERDFLIAELSSAVGLGGRDRKAASASERARLSVTRAIRSAIDRLRVDSPELARHLSATIKTGTFCSYLPDPRVAVTWRTSA